jgi:hypothetical protein
LNVSTENEGDGKKQHAQEFDEVLYSYWLVTDHRVRLLQVLLSVKCHYCLGEGERDKYSKEVAPQHHYVSDYKIHNAMTAGYMQEKWDAFGLLGVMLQHQQVDYRPQHHVEN